MLDFIRVNTELTGDQTRWTFIGTPGWRQAEDGIIYPPTWSLPNFYPPGWDRNAPPNHYAHELAKEDYAILCSQPLEDTDIRVDYKCPDGSVIHGGVIFRAMDSSRFYAVQIEDLGRKGQAYEISLWRQDGTGYQRELARGRAPHSVVPERLYQRGTRTRVEWDASSPEWAMVRVQATGNFIRVSMDGQIVFETRDRAYPVGCAGLVARGAVSFRNFTVHGTPGKRPEPWTVHEGELPRFFYPGGKQPEGFNAYPATCLTQNGILLTAWSHSKRAWDPADPTVVVLTRSEDLGRTWSPPSRVFSREGVSCGLCSIFSHLDGNLSGLIKAGQESVVIRSTDGGKNWIESGALTLGGIPCGDSPNRHPYSPATRLSDGTVVMTLYEANVRPGGDPGCNADRLDRSLFVRSLDDGYTWEKPAYIDENNFDHNECGAAEVEPGKLVAFMRTLAMPCMWTSRSEDGGKTWRPLVQSNVSAECPCLLRHSSGALILGSRGYGTFIHLSFDQGKSWTTRFRISPASAMMGMVELPDGRVFIAMHEGYRVPGNIRGQFFRVTPDGPVEAPL